MTVFEQLTQRRTIRKFKTDKIEREKLEKIAYAGLCAPNAGGRQAAKIIMLDNAELIQKIGIVNAACENRNWGGKSVSPEQPSIIDDLNIKSGFYGAPALGIVCVPKANYHAVNVIGTGFVCAENMVTAAYDLGVSSCIVGRAEATFQNEEMASLLTEWGLDEEYLPLVFVCLGYINGDYPNPKPRKEDRVIFVD